MIEQKKNSDGNVKPQRVKHNHDEKWKFAHKNSLIVNLIPMSYNVQSKVLFLPQKHERSPFNSVQPVQDQRQRFRLCKSLNISNIDIIKWENKL